MSTYPSADDYAFSLEPSRIKKYLTGGAPLLQTVAAGRLLIPKGAHYAHVANGFFAYIYRIKTATGEYALRCPRMRFPGDSAVRYQSLAAYLRATPQAKNYLVEADHFDDALWVSVGSQGQRFPVQVMGWIEGKTLLTAVAEKAKVGDKAGLQALAAAWEKLIIALKTDGVIHGDLHPDNVLVAPDGSLRLVDYDTLIVPGFTPSATTAGGMMTYFHPGFSRAGVARATVPHLDDFGAINIYLSLLALAHDPTLRETDEYLLFGTDDIESPGTSRHFMELMHHRDNKIMQLANAFFKECCAPTETGTLRVEQFLPVTPMALPWYTQNRFATPPPKLPHQKQANAPKEYIPMEHDLPSSVGAGGLRQHDAVQPGTELPSSIGKPGLTVHPYNPK